MITKNSEESGGTPFIRSKITIAKDTLMVLYPDCDKIEDEFFAKMNEGEGQEGEEDEEGKSKGKQTISY